ncbi:MAG: 3'-5' exonuclease domain-containing protein 2 [Proteobacteria bacterium]|nr:3'-5' exonuclease domain-containing protein 2 [Pseudomonadota bacterium]MBU1711143.1 3'-5' exonuclease domain-containing protein 2 [Pseudomonadota bacterium]
MTDTNKKISFKKRMTRDEINSLSITRYDGAVRIVRTPEALENALGKLAGETFLGFDTETRPAYRKGQQYPTSLLQLAGKDTIFLFQLGILGFPESLRNILADPKVAKAGVAIGQDIIKLKELGDFEEAGFIELADLAKQARIKNYGLRGLAALLLGIRIPKGAQQTNWATENLTPIQIQYASTDAWVSRRIYQWFSELGIL